MNSKWTKEFPGEKYSNHRKGYGIYFILLLILFKSWLTNGWITIADDVLTIMLSKLTMAAERVSLCLHLLMFPSITIIASPARQYSFDRHLFCFLSRSAYRPFVLLFTS